MAQSQSAVSRPRQGGLAQRRRSRAAVLTAGRSWPCQAPPPPRQTGPTAQQHINSPVNQPTHERSAQAPITALGVAWSPRPAARPFLSGTVPCSTSGSPN